MKTILIAEDNDINYEIFVTGLKKIDVSILHAYNGKEAVEMCKSNKDIELVIMDLNMPIMGGEEAAILIKEHNPNIIIISSTAYMFVTSIKPQNIKYFDGTVGKPIIFEKLIELINNLLLNRK